MLYCLVSSGTRPAHGTVCAVDFEIGDQYALSSRMKSDLNLQVLILPWRRAVYVVKWLFIFS